MKRPAILLALLSVVLLALVAAGCGGGGGGSERLSKDEFISKADGICADFEKKGNEIKPEGLPPGFDPTSANATDEQLDKFGDYIDKIADTFDDELNELRDLNPPENLESDWKRGLATLDETLNEFREAAEAAHDGDKTKLKDKVDEAQRHSNESDAIAKKLGLKVCGSSS